MSIRLGCVLNAAALGFVLVMSFSAHASDAHVDYIYTSAGDFREQLQYLKRPDIHGIQIVYSWSQLEKGEGQYDFSRIESDLHLVEAVRKKMFVQLQDRFFEPRARHIPDYLLTEPVYTGGLVAQQDNPGVGKAKGSGWVAQQWNPALRARFQKLLGALARQFDGRIQGVNLPETAIDIDMKHDKSGFSCDKYFAAELDNLAVAKRAFKKSAVVQYVNFWPCEWNNDHDYMGRLFEFATKHHIGLGGPDVVPYRKGQMKSSYPFFNHYRGRLPLVAMAVQEPTLTYINEKTGKPFTKSEFVTFARDYLGADIMFWSTSSPWLKE